MVELMKLRLHGNHDSHSTTKCFFAISSKNVVKNHLISNASRIHNFKLGNPKLCEVIDLSLLILKIEFLCGWACQILGRYRWKIGTKLEKCLISQGFEGEFLPFVFEW